MRKFCTSILLMLIGIIGLSAAVPTITEYSTLSPEAASASTSYGCSIVSQGDELFVGAPQANYVDIYKLNGNGYEFSQKIKAPAIANFFGYILAVSGDILMVVASTSKKIYSYKKTEGVWDVDLPVDSIVITQVPNALSFNNSKLAVSLSSGVELYSVNGNGYFTDKSNPYKFSDVTTAAGCFINGDTLFAVEKTKYVCVYEKINDGWILKKKFDGDEVANIGNANVTNFAYEKGEYIAGNHKVENICSFSKVNDEWKITIIDHPSSYTHADNVNWGRNVCLKDGIMMVSTNNKNYPIYIFKKVDGVWTEYLEANSTNQMGSSMTFNGRFIAVSNQLLPGTYFDKEKLLEKSFNNKGIVYVFDITQTPPPVPAAIGSLQQEQNIDMQIYDLQGRPVQNPTRGLYIKNHKLIMIK